VDGAVAAAGCRGLGFTDLVWMLDPAIQASEGHLTAVKLFRDVGFAEAEGLAGARRASCLPTHAAMRLRHGWGTRPYAISSTLQDACAVLSAFPLADHLFRGRDDATHL